MPAPRQRPRKLARLALSTALLLAAASSATQHGQHGSSPVERALADAKYDRRSPNPDMALLPGMGKMMQVYRRQDSAVVTPPAATDPSTPTAPTDTATNTGPGTGTVTDTTPTVPDTNTASQTLPTVTTPTDTATLPIETTPTTTPRASRTSATLPTSATSASQSVVVVVVTSLYTNADGSTMTSTGVSSSISMLPPSEAANAGNGGGGGSGKTWAIVGGVVGGVALLAGIVFIVWRCTQKRFADLDDTAEDIKWPELQMDGQTVSTQTSTLNPLATHRTGRAGIGDENEWDDQDPPPMPPSAGMGGHAGRMSQYGSHNYSPVGHTDPTVAGGQGYYDPFLGPSSAPHPAPDNIYPPSSNASVQRAYSNGSATGSSALSSGRHTPGSSPSIQPSQAAAEFGRPPGEHQETMREREDSGRASLQGWR